MKKKLAILTTVIVAGFSFGVMTVTFARHHPVAGVDYPYDPTAYYSQTVISWADSAPSTYALRDLAGQGGQVYDLTRHLKSIIFGDLFVDILGVENEKSKIDEKNTENWANSSIGSTISKTLSILKGLGNEHRDKYGNVTKNGDWSSSSVNDNNKKILETLERNHLDNVTNYDFTTQAGGLFWGGDLEDEGINRKATSPAAQAAWIKQTSSEIGESTKNIAADQRQIIAANEYALQLSEEAEGKVQAMIAKTIAQTIYNQALVDRNEMITKLLQLKSIDVMEKIDTEQHIQDLKDDFSYIAPSPTDENAYNYAKKTYGIEKLEGHGMPDFK